MAILFYFSFLMATLDSNLTNSWHFAFTQSTWPKYEVLKKAQETSIPPMHISCAFSIIHSSEDFYIFNYLSHFYLIILIIP